MTRKIKFEIEINYIKSSSSDDNLIYFYLEDKLKDMRDIDNMISNYRIKQKNMA